MYSGNFLIAASKNFAGQKVGIVSTFSLTILFEEFFDQSNRRISPASLEVFLESRTSSSRSRDEIKTCGDQNNFVASNFEKVV